MRVVFTPRIGSNSLEEKFNLTKGKIYDVEEIDIVVLENFYYIKNDLGSYCYYKKDNFVYLNYIRELKLNELGIGI